MDCRLGPNSGEVLLAGVAELLDAQISGNFQLKAKYLRAEKAYINARQHARADVYVKDSLSALASDNSNVYYYRRPRLIGQYMRQAGSVMYAKIKLEPCNSTACPISEDTPG